MCTEFEVRERVIEEAKADTPDVFAVYEGKDDLKFIVKVYNRALAILYSVNHEGMLSIFDKDRVRGRLSSRLIRHVFGFDDKDVRSFYRVAAC